MALQNLFKRLFGRGDLGTAAGAACRPVAEIFDRFLAVLRANNRALEIIADLGEKLSGDFIFDQRYIETTVDELAATVHRSIGALEELTGRTDQELHAVHRRLTDHLRAILAGHEDRQGPWLLDLDRVTPLDWALVGGKAAHLAEVIQDGQVPVPDGFVVTASAFHALIDENGLRQDLDRFEAMLADPSPLPPDFEPLRRRLHDGVLEATAPAALTAALAERLALLPPDATLAVRSSAQEEDMDFSFAGQYRSVLNVEPTTAAVFAAYRKVAASLFDERAVAYHRQIFPGIGQTTIAACCQQMIDARTSGIVYTVDTAAPAVDTLVVVGTWGQGESVAEGSTPTDTFVLAKGEAPQVIDRHLAVKPAGRYLAARGGLEERPLPDDLASRPCLDEAELIKLARQAIHLETLFKRPQDIEWAIDPVGGLHILQSRPLLVTEPTRERRPLPKSLAAYEVLVADRGKVAQQGIGAGPVHPVLTPADLEGFPHGGVLVSRRDSSQFVRVMGRAAAIVTEIGTPVSHMATLCRELKVPCLVGVESILSRVEAGETITVDAEDRRIYRGRVGELLTYQASTSMNIAASREFRLVRRILQAVSRLHLIDPLLQDFSPAGCRTYHDILRYVHETAVIELVELGRDERCLLRQQVARHLDLPIPAGIMVIDIGGGLAAEAPANNVPFSAVTSIPFRAILQGMLFPEVWHRASMQVGFKDLVSSMLSAPQDAVDGRYTGHNIAIVSRTYVNLCFRFGYHFNIIDAHCSEVERDNHIYFRFLGGATDLTKRSRRATLIATILEAFDFNVRTRGDLVIARAGNMVQSEMERILDILGRLVGFTRQLDVQLTSDRSAERYAEAFLAGDYGVVGR